MLCAMRPNIPLTRLLFMTYNGWVMLAVAVGAFIGHWTFGLKTSSTKSVACH
jgi:solute carrier family 31 (copper transporter), member 1